MNNAIRISRKDCAAGTHAVYRGAVLIATIHNGKPSRSNGRQAQFNVCRTTGRVDWFDSFANARDDALKG
jgi:hypothetical protein